MERYPVLSPFTLAFAKVYRGFMKESGITGRMIADKLGRNVGYVSERVSGKRALDTEDVDALAMLVGNGWTGRTLMIELARRARAHDLDELPENVGGSVHDQLPHFGKIDVSALRQSGVALAADERDGFEEEQEAKQELP